MVMDEVYLHIHTWVNEQIQLQYDRLTNLNKEWGMFFFKKCLKIVERLKRLYPVFW